MIDDKTQNLIDADYDGELAGRERALLDEVLLRDADARQYRDELRKLGEVIRSVPDAEPPQGLREAILADVARHTPRGGAGRWLRPALALAAAVVLALPVVWMLDSVDLDSSGQGLSGTMVRAPAVREADFNVRDGDLTANVRLTWRQDDLLVAFDVAASGPVVATVEYPRDRFHLDSGQDVDASAGKYSFEIKESGSPSVSLRALGEAAAGQAIRVTFAREGIELAAADLEIPPRE